MKALVIVAVLVVLGGVSLYFYKNNKINTVNDPVTTSLPSLEVNAVDIKATFKIITNGTTRIFTDSKYHNQSKDVFIEKTDPNIINIKKSGVTWSDFFRTLPMSLDKNCLITGTKQTFCTENGKFLKFYINETEDPNALEKVIKNDDKLLVIFE